MDYNGNDRGDRHGGGQWDRWNSNASHSSYYNQPTHRPYGQGFAIASLILGLLSVTVGCCGLGIPLGALGILFAIFVHRKGKRLDGTAKTGLTLSIIGFVIGVILTVYVFVSIPILMRDEAYREQLNAYFRLSTGMDFDEYLELIQENYGITFMQ